MKGFIQRHGEKVLGVLSGFDRMRFRGTLRLLTTVGGTMSWVSRAGVLLKDFVKFAEGLTRQVRQATEENAAAAGRAVRYLDRFMDKEALVRRIRGEQGLAANGLIAAPSPVNKPRGTDGSLTPLCSGGLIGHSILHPLIPGRPLSSWQGR